MYFYILPFEHSSDWLYARVESYQYRETDIVLVIHNILLQISCEL
jgi:hypothetical protein